MLFKNLAEAYDKIASVGGRKAVTLVLADTFTKALKESVDELVDIAYISANYVKADGVSEGVVTTAITSYARLDKHAFAKIVKKHGDVADAAEEVLSFAKKQTGLESFIGVKAAKAALTVRDILAAVDKIGQMHGENSIANKIRAMTYVFNNATPKESKYFIRMLLQSLKINVSSSTTFSALSLAIFGTQAEKDGIVAMYNANQDLRVLIQTLVKRGVVDAQIVPGQFLKMMLAGRIAYTEIVNKQRDIIAEYKYDGERAQVHKVGKRVVIYSRGGKEITQQFPEIAEDAQQCQFDVVFEGEIVAMEGKRMLPFQALGHRRRKEAYTKLAVSLFVFDVLYAEKQVLIGLPLADRRRYIKYVCSGCIEPAKGKHVATTDDILDFYGVARSAGAEGIICKDLTSLYLPNKRGYEWIKMKGTDKAKMADTLDLAIYAANYGMGKNAGQYGTFFCALLNSEKGTLEYLCRLGSGFSEAELDDFYKLLNPYETKTPLAAEKRKTAEVYFSRAVIVEVACDEISENSATPSGFGVRFPVFKRLRRDKDTPTTLNEIRSMFRAVGR